MRRSSIIRAVLIGGRSSDRHHLTTLLAATGGAEVVAEPEGTSAILRVCAQLGVDVAFLDTHLPGSDVRSLSTSLAGLPEPPLVIFVSDSTDAAFTAFQAHAIDYLLKPLTAGQVQAAVLHLEQRLRERDASRDVSGTQPDEQLLPVRDRGRDVARLLRRSEVVAVLRHDHRTWVHTADAEFPSLDTVAALAAWLGGAPFLRAARGAVVNMAAVAEIIHYGDRLYRLRLRDRRGTVVTVSRSGAGLIQALLSTRL